MEYDYENSAGWDCDPNAVLTLDEDELDEEDSTGDWQEHCLSRWADRECYRAMTLR